MIKLSLPRSVQDLASLLDCDGRAVVTVKAWLVELLEVRTVTVGQKSDRRGRRKAQRKPSSPLHDCRIIPLMQTVSCPKLYVVNCEGPNVLDAEC